MEQASVKALQLRELWLREKRVALLGVPLELGASRPGAGLGPPALRAAGLCEVLTQRGMNVDDYGDIAPDHLHGPDDGPDETPPSKTHHYRDIAAWTRLLSAQAYSVACSGARPIFLGGDHSLSMGSVNGMARYWREQGRELFVLWLDAHADYNTPVTSPTGNMHGMSAAFLCGEPGLDHLLGDEPRVSIRCDQLSLLGTRSIDPQERKLLRNRGISVFDMHDIAKSGVAILVKQVIDRVKAYNGVLHVSLDVDFLDPSVAPGVGTTVSGGVSYSQAQMVMRLLCEAALVGSLDIVELNPLLDEHGNTARIMTELAGALFVGHLDHVLPPSA
jgi:arginase